MITLCQAEQCTGCGVCAAVCPQKAITMQENTEGFVHPVIHGKKCVDCGVCARKCPVLNAQQHRDNLLPYRKAYAAASREQSLREKAATAGAAAEISRWCIRNGYTVFGAAYTADFAGAVHIAVTKEEDLWKLSGSKYIQSRLDSAAYFEIRQLLSQGCKVLFVGTGCQIAGVHSFLGGKQSGLLTVELCCHGVPSAGAWRKYLKWKTRGNPISAVNMKDKRFGWRTNALSIAFANGEEYVSREDEWKACFACDLLLRKSCTVCPFKGNTGADLIIGDFWGKHGTQYDVEPKNTGLNFVITQTDKGAEIVNRMAPFLHVQECQYTEILAGNSSLEKPSTANPHRDRALALLRKYPFDLMVEGIFGSRSEAGLLLWALKKKAKEILRR